MFPAAHEGNGKLHSASDGGSMFMVCVCKCVFVRMCCRTESPPAVRVFTRRQCAGDARVCVAMFAWSTCVYLCALAVTDGALLCQPAACASARGRAGSWSGSWRRRCPSWPAVAAPPPSSTTATLVSVRHPTWSSYPMYPQSSSLCAHRSKSLSLWFI